eukprot:956738-Alexandrium_andersonii.AAC.1
MPHWPDTNVFVDCPDMVGCKHFVPESAVGLRVCGTWIRGSVVCGRCPWLCPFMVRGTMGQWFVVCGFVVRESVVRGSV